MLAAKSSMDTSVPVHTKAGSPPCLLFLCHLLWAGYHVQSHTRVVCSASFACTSSEQRRVDPGSLPCCRCRVACGTEFV
eukprot:scaffold135953_cov21-Tisochrysis_lutea.AAC.1